MTTLDRSRMARFGLDRMPVTGALHRPNTVDREDTQTLNPTTLATVIDPGQLVAVGVPSMVKDLSRLSGGRADVGGRPAAENLATIRFPLATDARPGDVYTVTACEGDALTIGARFKIEAVRRSSHAVFRTVTASEYRT